MEKQRRKAYIANTRIIKAINQQPAQISKEKLVFAM